MSTNDDFNIDYSDVNEQIKEIENSYKKKEFGKDDRFLVVNKTKKDAKTDSETYWLYFIPKYVKVKSIDGKKEITKAQKGIFSVLRHKFEYEVDKPDGSGKTKKWINFVCPKTFDSNAKCFCCDLQTQRKASELQADKDEAKLLRYSTSYASNVFVTRNNVDTTQETKVKIYEFTYQISQKVNKILSPTQEEKDNDPDIVEINIWDVMKTAVPFKLKVEFEAGKSMPSYINSAFEPKYTGPIKTALVNRDENGKLITFKFTGDKTAAEIFEICFEKAYDLYEVYKEKELLTYEQTKEKMNSYLGISSAGEEEVAKAAEDEIFNQKNKNETKSKAKVETKKETKSVETKQQTSDIDSEEDLKNEFDDLLNSSDLDDVLGDV